MDMAPNLLLHGPALEKPIRQDAPALGGKASARGRPSAPPPARFGSRRGLCTDCRFAQGTAARTARSTAEMHGKHHRIDGAGRVLEVLALELGELDAVGGVRDVEVEHGPDEREAARFAGEAADDLGAAFDLAERAFEQVRAPPPAAVARRVA